MSETAATDDTFFLLQVLASGKFGFTGPSKLVNTRLWVAAVIVPAWRGGIVCATSLQYPIVPFGIN